MHKNAPCRKGVATRKRRVHRIAFAHAPASKPLALSDAIPVVPGGRLNHRAARNSLKRGKQMRSAFLKFFAIVLGVALTFAPCGFSQISNSCSSSPYQIGCGVWIDEWAGSGSTPYVYNLTVGGTLGNLIVISNVGAGNMPAVYTVYHNGVATALTCTVGPHPTDPTANNSAIAYDQNVSHYFTATAGDTIQLRASFAGSPVTPISATWEVLIGTAPF